MGYTNPYLPCDVLVASHDPATLRTTGIDVVEQLWSHDISGELAQDSRSPEDLMSKYREDHHSWIVIIKQDSVLKIKSIGRKEVPDVEIPFVFALPSPLHNTNLAAAQHSFSAG